MRSRSELERLEQLLSAREDALERAERELQRRQAAIDEQLREIMAQLTAEAMEKENYAVGEDRVSELELAQMSGSRSGGAQARDVSLQWVLSHLEDHYKCTLCMDIMATPYALNNAHCGHTFCASCLLQWAFADLCPDCHFWHEPLRCPLCRAALPCRREGPPRTPGTFPFVPNRVAGECVGALVAVLQRAADSVDDGPDGGGSRWHGQLDEKVLVWGEAESTAAEWRERARRGETDMTMLADLWEHLTMEDLGQFKQIVDRS